MCTLCDIIPDITCTPLTSIANTTLNETSGVNGQYASTATFACLPGQKFPDESTVKVFECSKSPVTLAGAWNDTIAPCTRMYCICAFLSSGSRLCQLNGATSHDASLLKQNVKLSISCTTSVIILLLLLLVLTVAIDDTM